MSLGFLLAQWILHQPPAAKNILSMSWDPGTSQTNKVGTLRYKHSYLLKTTLPCHYSEDSFSLARHSLKKYEVQQRIPDNSLNITAAL